MFYEHLADASGTALMRLRFALINIFLKNGHFWSPLYTSAPNTPRNLLLFVKDSYIVFSVGLHNFTLINRDLCVCEARVILTA